MKHILKAQYLELYAPNGGLHRYIMSKWRWQNNKITQIHFFFAKTNFLPNINWYALVPLSTNSFITYIVVSHMKIGSTRPGKTLHFKDLDGVMVSMAMGQMQFMNILWIKVSTYNNPLSSLLLIGEKHQIMECLNGHGELCLLQLVHVYLKFSCTIKPVPQWPRNLKEMGD